MSPRSVIAAAAFSLLALAGPLPAHAVDPLPPSYVYAGAATGAGLFSSISVSDESLSDVGTVFAEVPLYAKAQTSFGSNKALADATPDVLGSTVAAGFSVWQDSFTVTGGSGPGTADISITLTGNFGTGFGSALNFALIWLETPLTTQEQVLAYANTLLDIFSPPSDSHIVIADLAVNPDNPDDSNVSRVLTGTYPFTYDTQFHFLSMMTAVAFGEGSVDFFGTAAFGISAPGTITSASNTAYAAAVPEPGTWAMMLAGLLALALLGARRRALVGPRRKA